MEFIKPGTYIDFMRHRRPVVAGSLVLVAASVALFFYPGPNYGIDFRGGTEIQAAFQGEISSAELRGTLESLGYRRPDVVAVEGSPNEYIVRVREVSSLPSDRASQVETVVDDALDEVSVQRLRFKPGDLDEETGRIAAFKIDLRLSGAAAPEDIERAIEGLDIPVRSVSQVGREQDYRYVVQLEGLGDELVRQLREELGARGPEAPRRVEWVGPKAGAQLRDAAIKALLYAIAFIMLYVAFRFDLRFAPGAVVAMAHDVLITVGIYILVSKELNLTTVAALLTILGYSINDTIVVFDRIRENMSRMRDRSMRELINVSTSQMLSRTIVTSGTTLLSMSAFFVWGTAVIQDIAFALIIGIAIGTYSSIYIAAPITEWMDKKLFSAGR